MRLYDMYRRTLRFLIHYGMTDECLYSLRPFIIMEYAKHAYDLTKLSKEQDSTGDAMAIDPNITNEKLSIMCL